MRLCFANIEVTVTATEKEQTHSFTLSKMLHLTSDKEPRRGWLLRIIKQGDLRNPPPRPPPSGELNESRLWKEGEQAGLGRT